MTRKMRKKLDYVILDVCAHGVTANSIRGQIPYRINRIDSDQYLNVPCIDSTNKMYKKKFVYK